MEHESIARYILEQSLPYLEAVAEVSIQTRDSAFWKGSGLTTGGRTYLLVLATKLLLNLPLTPLERQHAYFINNIENLDGLYDVQRLVICLYQQRFQPLIHICDNCAHREGGVCYEYEGDNYGHATNVSPRGHCGNWTSHLFEFIPPIGTGEGLDVSNGHKVGNLYDSDKAKANPKEGISKRKGEARKSQVKGDQGDAGAC